MACTSPDAECGRDRRSAIEPFLLMVPGDLDTIDRMERQPLADDHVLTDAQLDAGRRRLERDCRRLLRRNLGTKTADALAAAGHLPGWPTFVLCTGLPGARECALCAQCAVHGLDRAAWRRPSGAPRVHDRDALLDARRRFMERLDARWGDAGVPPAARRVVVFEAGLAFRHEAVDGGPGRDCERTLDLRRSLTYMLLQAGYRRRNVHMTSLELMIVSGNRMGHQASCPCLLARRLQMEPASCETPEAAHGLYVDVYHQSAMRPPERFCVRQGGGG